MKQVIYKLISRIDPGCEAVSRTSSCSLDRSLSLKERLKLYLHFLMCGFCRRYHRQILFIQKLTNNIDAEAQISGSVSPGLSPEAKERIKRVIDTRTQ